MFRSILLNKPSTIRFASTQLGKIKLITPASIINEIPSLKLNITERAANKLNQIYSTSNEILRIEVENGGCHGYQYNFNLLKEGKDATETSDDEFKDEDVKNITIITQPGKVIIDSNSLKILNNGVLNYTTELIGSSFKIESEALKSSCGCGTSFDIET
ncbi:hypothetical protein C6P44_002069 [Monosporozyma unispora]|nr:hypothetical protein C6P44_002069 [Kazachstania unispora]